MATNLPPFLVEYLLRQGLFSNRFSTPEDTQETPKKEQELTFEKVLQDILDGGLDREDTTSVSSAPSPAPSPAPSSATSSTGGLFGLGDIGQAINDVLSFDLGQAAIDAAEEATGRDLSFEGLFGTKAPSFLGELERATPGYTARAIMSSPHSTTGQKIGAGAVMGLMSLAPFGLTALGTGLNAMGASDPFDAARDIDFDYDVISGVSTISPKASSLSEDEPNVTRNELGFAADIADLAAAKGLEGLVSRGVGATVSDFLSDIGQVGAVNFGTQFGMTPDFADFGVKGISGIDKLTTSALDTLGFGGGFGAPGQFSARPDFTSPFGFAPGYHSPSFDPSTVGPPSFESPSYSPDTGQLDFGVDSGLQGGRSAGRGGPDLSGPDMDFGDPSYDPGFDEPGGYGGADGPDGSDSGNDDGGFDGGLGY
jgi:hypothetical protein